MKKKIFEIIIIRDPDMNIIEKSCKLQKQIIKLFGYYRISWDTLYFGKQEDDN